MIYPTSKNEKLSVAVVLVVKNEKTTILSWISWYKTLGFDKIIVFDDRSDDGTDVILADRAKGGDILLEELVGDVNDWFYERQQRCYRRAIEKYKAHCDWMAFFDADEYLYLVDQLDIRSFLSKFGGAHAIAVNWCNYGSSGHVLRPTLPPVETYTWHSLPTNPVNRHIKTILMPRYLGDTWHNVHGFDIEPSKYFLANGSLVTWGTQVGILNRDADWTIAKLLHFQCRSMEDFVDRARKRPELNASVALWTACDFHDLNDLAPGEYSLRMRSMTKINHVGQSFEDQIVQSDNEGSCLVSTVKEYLSPLTLDEIGLLTGTDKSSRHHGYLNFYDSFLCGIRGKSIALLEIGVDKGASINMWANYFGSAQITGIDINPAAMAQQSERITICIGDQSDETFLHQVCSQRGHFDVIVDDGSHIWDHQIISFRTLFASVKPGGYYIIEDLQTSFEYHDSYDHFKAGRNQSAVEYLLHLAKMLVARHIPISDDQFLAHNIRNIDYISFHYGAALIKKRS